jgi:hypothetical protein
MNTRLRRTEHSLIRFTSYPLHSPFRPAYPIQPPLLQTLTPRITAHPRSPTYHDTVHDRGTVRPLELSGSPFQSIILFPPAVVPIEVHASSHIGWRQSEIGSPSRSAQTIQVWLLRGKETGVAPQKTFRSLVSDSLHHNCQNNLFKFSFCPSLSSDSFEVCPPKRARRPAYMNTSEMR